MKYILMQEINFNNEFDATLNSLLNILLKNPTMKNNEILRKFHYEIIKLKQKLEEY